MLFPKPYYLDKMNKLHAQEHQALNNIPMQEQKPTENQGLLESDQKQREDLVQQVEYNQNQ